MISVGTLDHSLVHPRKVFRPAIRDAAKSIILVHNHPSGDATPSQEDLLVTKKLEDAGSTLGIQVLDRNKGSIFALLGLSPCDTLALGMA